MKAKLFFKAERKLETLIMDTKAVDKSGVSSAG